MSKSDAAPNYTFSDILHLYFVYIRLTSIYVKIGIRNI